MGSIIGPRQVRAADLNADGTQDLLVPDHDEVEVLLGHGDGTFNRAADPDLDGNPIAVVIDDFDRDGTLDIVAANLANHDLSVALGHGDGTFQTEIHRTLGTPPSAIASADLNGDGRLDLVVGSADGGVLVVLGNGDGTFQDPVSYSLDLLPLDIAVADVDQDGRIDIIGVDGFSGDVFVSLGNGDGTVKDAQRYSNLSGPVALAVGDLDRDGAPDIVVANHDRQSLSILTHTGDRSRSPPPAGGGAVGSFGGFRLASRSGPVCTAARHAGFRFEDLEIPAVVRATETARATVQAAPAAPAPAVGGAAGSLRRL